MSTQLYLIRHAPAAAASGCLVGSSDVPLSGKGQEPLAAIVPLLDGLDRWYCSPMLRTRQTLVKLQSCGLDIAEVQIDSRLREIDFGRWECKSFQDIAEQEPDVIVAWQAYADFVFPEGESVKGFTRRVRELLDEFSAADDQRIAVMTHGGVIRTMICLALGIPESKYLLFDVQPASLTMLTLFDQGGVLNGLNIQGRLK